jgi:hypothetical protein
LEEALLVVWEAVSGVVAEETPGLERSDEAMG